MTDAVKPVVTTRESVAVSVVICVRDRESMIRRCLKSVLAAGPAEVVVIDDGSTDGTAAAARQLGVRVVSTGRSGLAAARATGAREAGHDVVVYVDSDVVLTPTALRALLDEADAGAFDAVQARIAAMDDAGSYWQRSEAWRRDVQERPGPARVLTFQATLVRRQLLLDIGFDPVFSGAGEDHDFFYRAGAAGARLAHSATALAFHEDRPTLRAFVQQRLWHGRGMARLLVRYGRTETRASPAAAATAIAPTRLPFMVVSWIGLLAGLVVETVHLAQEPGLRTALNARRTSTS